MSTQKIALETRMFSLNARQALLNQRIGSSSVVNCCVLCFRATGDPERGKVRHKKHTRLFCILKGGGGDQKALYSTEQRPLGFSPQDFY